MYIFGYSFQEGLFKGSPRKRAHWKKTLGLLTTSLPSFLLPFLSGDPVQELNHFGQVKTTALLLIQLTNLPLEAKHFL